MPRKWGSLFFSESPYVLQHFGGRCDRQSSVSWEVKKGNLVPRCRCLSSSLLLPGQKNTRNIVVSGVNSSSTDIRVNDDVACLAEKSQKTLQK